MTQAQNAGFRVLARDIAQELNADEIAQVSGGSTSCTAKATWSEKTGNDVEVSCTVTTG
jgi:hypothetical protein